MFKYENHCVDCGKHCLYDSCPYYNVMYYYCDKCGEQADYSLDDEDFCEICAGNYLTKQFDTLSVTEKAELLDISIKGR